ncbi:MAG: YihY/virulence factor BrkB family protein [Alistipes sp.]|nr:YihY/virulence factor BrkB family protein [Alistipes sp.]
MNKPLKFLYDWIAAIANIPGLKWTARPLKLVIYTLEGLLAHGTMDMGAALTFYTLVSIVPVLALAFAVVKGFGLAESLVQNLYSLLPQMPEVVDYMVSFANNTLARTNGGVMATIGLLTLLWAVVNLFESIEANFNKIWEVKSSRNLVRKYSDYITVVIIAPLLWIVATSVGTYTRDMLGIEGVWWLNMASKLFSLMLVWAMFTVIYIVLPNTKVRLRAAIMAGVFAGTGFYLFQTLFIFLMKWMTSYSAIYGSFAALPLFLLWMQYSWKILLMGCELSFALQNEKRYDEERELPVISHDDTQKFIIAIVCHIARSFVRGEGAVPLIAVRERLGIPSRIASKLILILVDAGILNEVKCEQKDYDVAYAPAKDVNSLRVCDILEAVELFTEHPVELNITSQEVQQARGIIDEIKGIAAASESNKKIIELIDNE